MMAYQIENELRVEEFKALLIKSTLDERRPVDNPYRLKKMMQHGNLIITARENGQLVGVSRSLTDFEYCTYLSDLAVDIDFQKNGIGKELIRQTKLNTPNAMLILLSAPEAIQYYPKIGMSRFDHCYILRNVDELG